MAMLQDMGRAAGGGGGFNGGEREHVGWEVGSEKEKEQEWEERRERE